MSYPFERNILIKFFFKNNFNENIKYAYYMKTVHIISKKNDIRVPESMFEEFMRLTKVNIQTQKQFQKAIKIFKKMVQDVELQDNFPHNKRTIENQKIIEQKNIKKMLEKEGMYMEMSNIIMDYYNSMIYSSPPKYKKELEDFSFHKKNELVIDYGVEEWSFLD